ncbi:hypothetical protein SDC9_110692 [bioreactor metagenome]|uniref:DUF2231 domain-containing protein n=1 Tax=bioreactor metagenome TaxID=1076179 RepID=A0A645BFH8_9ZZZZ|nr:DUF2231 domain-containing protein [Paludibacter sp.]
MLETSHLHPMLVHFPIALVAIGFLADLASIFIKKELCFSKMSFYLLITGTLGAMAAVFTGVFFTSEMSGEAGNIMEKHELIAFVTLSLLVITSVFRIVLLSKPENKNLKWLSFIFYALATIAVSLTGFLGGTLVYGYMMPI